jgi:hypothetical protein
MSLISWRRAAIAKNHLNEDGLAALNNLVEQYLVFATGQAMRRIPMRMADWIANLDAFLTARISAPSGRPHDSHADAQDPIPP